MKKVLLVAHVSGFVPQFELNNVKILQELGYEVHYASNFMTPAYGYDNERLKDTGIILHQVDFVKLPISINTIHAKKQMDALFRMNHFNLVHCHTPMGGALARICAAPYRKKGTKIIYTAHGFHFYHGAPLSKWIFYPAEWLLSFKTDVQICINQEDINRAMKHWHSKQVKYCPGVGIDLKAVCPEKYAADRVPLRNSLKIPETAKLLLSAGELSPRKNHAVLIRAMSFLPKDYQLLLCGEGSLRKSLEHHTEKLHLENQVHFLGYRSDIFCLMAAADIFLLPSLQEGLPHALLEAMAMSMPVICTDIRGNRDLVDGNGGILIKSDRHMPETFAAAVLRMGENKNLRNSYGSYNRRKAEGFNLSKVDAVMRRIYSSVTE